MANACDTHCCPVHGCKYGKDFDWVQMKDVEGCDVLDGKVKPVNPNNNGCEWCEEASEREQEVMKVLGVEEVFSYGWKRPDGTLIVSGTCNSREVAQYKADLYRDAKGLPTIVARRFISEWEEVK